MIFFSIFLFQLFLPFINGRVSYRVLFLYDTKMKNDYRDTFRDAIEKVSGRLNAAVTSDQLSINNDQQDWENCRAALLRQMPWLPTETPTVGNQQSRRGEFTLVAYMFLHKHRQWIEMCEPTNDTAEPVDYVEDPSSGGQSCLFESSQKRPTHAVLWFCSQKIHIGILSYQILHNLLHVMTANSLARKHGCDNCSDAYTKVKYPMGYIDNTTLEEFDYYLITTEEVKKAVQEHFDCPTVQGAELLTIHGFKFNSTETLTRVDFRHWSFRLFSDEILSPRIGPDKRISKLTLAALKDSGWYEVDFSKAEALAVSKPTELGCEIATQHCRIFMKNATDHLDRTRVQPIAPYCKSHVEWTDKDAKRNKTKLFIAAGDQTVSPRCSRDGKTVLSCTSGMSAISDGCPVIMPASIRGEQSAGITHYDYPVCAEANKEPYMMEDLGGKTGLGTICVTVVELMAKHKVSGYLPLTGMCVEAKCHQQSKAVKIIFAAGRHQRKCEFLCNQDDANQLTKYYMCDDHCYKYMYVSVSIICPKYEDVCIPSNQLAAASNEEINATVGTSRGDCKFVKPTKPPKIRKSTPMLETITTTEFNPYYTERKRTTIGYETYLSTPDFGFSTSKGAVISYKTDSFLVFAIISVAVIF